MIDQRESFATRAYVVGEVVITALALIGGFMLVYFGEPEVKLVGAGLLPALLVFWFQRRAAESATAQLARMAEMSLMQTQAQGVESRAQQAASDAVAALRLARTGDRT
jgi:hypothetical protein